MLDPRLHPANVVTHDKENIGFLRAGCLRVYGRTLACDEAGDTIDPRKPISTLLPSLRSLVRRSLKTRLSLLRPQDRPRTHFFGAFHLFSGFRGRSTARTGFAGRKLAAYIRGQTVF